MTVTVVDEEARGPLGPCWLVETGGAKVIVVHFKEQRPPKGRNEGGLPAGTWAFRAVEDEDRWIVDPRAPKEIAGGIGLSHADVVDLLSCGVSA